MVKFQDELARLQKEKDQLEGEKNQLEKELNAKIDSTEDSDVNQVNLLTCITYMYNIPLIHNLHTPSHISNFRSLSVFSRVLIYFEVLIGGNKNSCVHKFTIYS